MRANPGVHSSPPKNEASDSLARSRQYPDPPGYYASVEKPVLQFEFELDANRGTHLLSLFNTTQATLPLQEIMLISNADIINPWQMLGLQWMHVSKTQQGDAYLYHLQLAQPLLLQAGKNKILEYNVQNALGPITNVAMPPKVVEIRLQNSKTETLTSVDSNNPQQNPHSNIEFNMYHANWGQYQFARTINNEFLTDINSLSYGFIGFDANGQVSSLDSWGDQLELPLLALKKQNNPFLKTALSFGGWTNAGKRMDTIFSQMAANPASRRNFVENAVQAVIQAHADGIDIDWEYVKSEDADNFVLLLQELRNALILAQIPNPRLTIAAPAGIENIQVFSKAQWQDISTAVDRISIMTYDYFGDFSALSDFHSAWTLSPSSPHNQGNEAHYCIEKTLGVYDALGLSRNKLALGIPNYARSMIVEKTGDFAGLYQKVLAGAKGDDGSNFSWDEIQKFLNNAPSLLDSLGVKKWNYYDASHPLCSAAKMSLLSGELDDGRCIVINFVDPISATWRGQEAQKLGLGGVMMWANYNDSLARDHSLTHAVSKGLTPSPQPAPSIENLEHYAKKLNSSFFVSSSKKLKVVNQLLTAKRQEDSKKIHEIFNNHQNTLGQHRNIVKFFISMLAPNLARRLFDAPQSLKLAWALLIETPTALIKARPIPCAPPESLGQEEVSSNTMRQGQ